VFESDSSLLVILLSSILAVSLLLLTTILGISRALERLERRLADLKDASAGSATAPSAAETSAGGAFETFLSEDPQRRSMAKAEQFAEYRRWRQAHGLNWSGS
jgi:hypothetical protein